MTDAATIPQIKDTAAPGMLVLGWQVTPKLEPRFWLQPTASPGGQSDHDLIRISAKNLGCHTAIVAQSGSGKSFFLGRLVEELLLATKAHCIIFDPNADFRRVTEVVNAEHWKKASYDAELRRGFLPHEGDAQAFTSRWQEVSKRLQGGPSLKPGPNTNRMRLDWSSLSVEFLSGDVNPELRAELYHCHEFVKAVAQLLLLKNLSSSRQQESSSDKSKRTGAQKTNLIKEAHRILRRTRLMTGQDRKDIFEIEFSGIRNTGALDRPGNGILSFFRSFSRFSSLLSLARANPQETIDRAIAAVDYISEQAERYYFSKAEEYAAKGIIETSLPRPQGQKEAQGASSRLEVIDLPSFGDSKTRLLPLNSVLSTVWEQARLRWADAMERSAEQDIRVPTFIVVDEAHNLIPAEKSDPAGEVLREQFRTIAAEGRKYGLFLIICTQRPDKIDPMVLSECENIAIMRLGSRSVLNTTTELLGLEDMASPDVLSRCLQFSTGRALLLGRWTKGEPELIYTAMRRTVEGGRNLREEYWASPAPAAPAPAAPAPAAPAPAAPGSATPASAIPVAAIQGNTMDKKAAEATATGLRIKRTSSTKASRNATEVRRPAKN